MTKSSRFVSVLGGWLLAGLAGVAQGQYQDTDGGDARMFSSNGRVQSNLSDQGTGHSPSQLGLYGPYYNRLLNRQNNLNNSYPRRAGENDEQGQVNGLPNRGLPFPSDLNYAEMARQRKTRRAPSTEALGLTLAERDGRLLVVRVRDDSVMARVGLEAGDQIEAVNTKTVHSSEEFQQALESLIVGQEVPIVINRGDHSDIRKWIPQANELKSAESETAAGEHPFEAPNQIHFITAARLGRGPRGQSFLGVELDLEISNQAIVRAVVPGSPAQAAGLQPGDRICALSGLSLQSPQDLDQILVRDRPGVAVYLYVGRTPLPAVSRSDRPDELPAPAGRTPVENIPQHAKSRQPAP